MRAFLRSLVTVSMLLGWTGGLGQTIQPGNPPPAPSAGNPAGQAPGTATIPVTATAGLSVKESMDLLLGFERLIAERARQHQEFIEKNAKEHQVYLQSWYEKLLKVVAGLGAAFAGLVLFFNHKTKTEIQAEVGRLFQERAASAIEKEIRSFNTHLERVKAGLEKEVLELKTKTDQDSRIIAEYAAIVGHAAVVLSLPEDGNAEVQKKRKREREAVLDRLQKLLCTFPWHRTLGIFIGRLYRSLEELEQAINALDQVVNARRQKGLPEDADLAAILFNKACYLNLRAQKSQTERERAALQKAAVEVLEESCRLDPSGRDWAQTDEDLKGVGGITAKHQPPRPSPASGAS